MRNVASFAASCESAHRLIFFQRKPRRWCDPGHVTQVGTGTVEFINYKSMQRHGQTMPPKMFIYVNRDASHTCITFWALRSVTPIIIDIVTEQVKKKGLGFRVYISVQCITGTANDGNIDKYRCLELGFAGKPPG